MPADTREHIVDAAGALLRRQGYAATGVKQIVAEADARLASLYHFFPGGKSEVAAAAIRRSGAAYGQLLDLFFADVDDLPGRVHAFFLAAAETLVATDYADACPIATVALEVASTDDRLRRATADVFDAWIDAATARFSGPGTSLDPAAARALALALIAQLEGAFVLARALRSTEPLENAAAVMAAHTTALAGVVTRRESGRA